MGYCGACYKSCNLIHMIKNSKNRSIWIAISSTLILAITVICFSARGDLWLDEIWSIFMAELSTGPWDIFTRFQHDNNHFINTIYLYFLGRQKYFFLYRMLAVCSGIGSLFLLTYIAGRRGHVEALFATVLAGFSYPLVLYFSEARGYAPAVFCALLAFVYLQKCLDRATAGRLIIFWFAVIAGILSHLSFVMVIIAMFVFTVIVKVNNRRNVSIVRKTAEISLLYLVPLLFCILFYIFFIKHMVVGGGPIYKYRDVIGQTACFAMGVPLGKYFQIMALLFCGVILISGCLMLAKERKYEWVFFAMVLLVSPAVILALARPKCLYLRYFIVCFPFFYLLACYLAGACFRRKELVFRLLAVAIVLFMTLGQIDRLISLMVIGRGSYRDALLDIASCSAKDVIKISTDHDFQGSMICSFYERFLPAGQKVQYIEKASCMENKPEWVLTQSQDSVLRPKPELFPPWGIKYRLVGIYKTSELSGWNWYLYHNDDVLPRKN